MDASLSALRSKRTFHGPRVYHSRGSESRIKPGYSHKEEKVRMAHEDNANEDRNAGGHGEELVASNGTEMEDRGPGHGDEEEKKKKKKRGNGKVVVVAMDGSDLSSQALRWVLENLILRKAENDEDSDELVLFHAQQIAPANCNLGITTQEMIDAIKEQEEDAAAQILESGKKLCEERNVKVRAIVKSGDPRDHICEIVENEEADLLVMGNNGHGTLKRFLLGSTSDYCVHRVKCHVIIAKDLQST